MDSLNFELYRQVILLEERLNNLEKSLNTQSLYEVILILGLTGMGIWFLVSVLKTLEE